VQVVGVMLLMQRVEVVVVCWWGQERERAGE